MGTTKFGTQNSKAEQEVQLFGPKFKEVVTSNFEFEEFLAVQLNWQFNLRKRYDNHYF